MFGYSYNIKESMMPYVYRSHKRIHTDEYDWGQFYSTFLIALILVPIISSDYCLNSVIWNWDIYSPYLSLHQIAMAFRLSNTCKEIIILSNLW